MVRVSTSRFDDDASDGDGGDGGLSLTVPPTEKLDVRDLSLADGASVDSWGFISSWGLETPTYNESENAVDFASAASADILSVSDFNAIAGFSCTFLIRQCSGSLLFASVNTQDIDSRLIMQADNRAGGIRGGRTTDAESFKNIATPSTFLSTDAPWFVATIVADFAAGEIRGYNNGGVASRISTEGSGATDATPSKNATLFGAARADAVDLTFSGLVKNVNLYDSVLTEDEIRQEAAFLLSLVGA